MSKRKILYCGDEEVWERVVLGASERGLSISQLLLSPFRSGAVRSVGRGTPIYGDGVSEVGPTEKTTRGDMVVPMSDRERFKIANPRKVCPACHKFNKDCEC